MKHPFVFTSPTDKQPGGWHGAYLGVYATLFAPLKDTTDSIAELGVDGGGSLLMYADYFSQASAVVGMDIQPRPESLGERITFYQANAYSQEGHNLLFSKCENPFALIVDDGSHFLGHQQFFCKTYPHLLSQDGLAIVEDVPSIDHIAELAKAVPPGFYSFAIDLRHYGRYDNILFVITRE